MRQACWLVALLWACQADPLPDRSRFADQRLDASDGQTVADGATADASAADGAPQDAADVTATDAAIDASGGAPGPCSPCTVDSDCLAGSACLKHGSLPPYCGAPCTGGCQPGWTCQTRTSVSGQDVPQCVPVSDICPCPVGGPETCNAKDDDCDGTTDEGTCDDGNSCTQDQCNNGICQTTPAGATCDDGDACSLGDQCQGGTCIGGTAKNCSDGLPCTEDLCTLGQCSHPLSSKPCDDGNPCTDNDHCSGGGCSGQPKGCQDGFDCTLDSCSAATGACVHTPNDGICDEGSVCTLDKCSATTGCSATAISCDDGLSCTSDGCLAATGCYHTVACDDLNDCTIDVCKANGCEHSNAPKTQTCTVTGKNGFCTGFGSCCVGSGC